MEMKSFGECLNVIDHLAYEDSVMCVVNDQLKDIREYIKQTHNDLTNKNEYIDDMVA